MESEHTKGEEKGFDRVSPFFIPMVISNMAAGNVSIQFGLKGKSINVVTACATGAHCIGTALRDIRHGYIDAALAGGVNIMDVFMSEPEVRSNIGKALKGVSQSGNDMVPGDFIMMTKAVGLEGSGIIASDYEEQLSSVLSSKELARAKSFLELVSVVPEGIAAGSIGTHGMHDITEGGILGAVWEMCQISGRGAQVWEHEIPIEPETVKICDHYEIDPLRLISSGSMVIIVPKEKKEQMEKAMAEAGVACSVIGRIEEADFGIRLLKNGAPEAGAPDSSEDLVEIDPPYMDELYKVVGKE